MSRQVSVRTARRLLDRRVDNARAVVGQNIEKRCKGRIQLELDRQRVLDGDLQARRKRFGWALLHFHETVKTVFERLRINRGAVAELLPVIQRERSGQ